MRLRLPTTTDSDPRQGTGPRQDPKSGKIGVVHRATDTTAPSVEHEEPESKANPQLTSQSSMGADPRPGVISKLDPPNGAERGPVPTIDMSNVGGLEQTSRKVASGVDSTNPAKNAQNQHDDVLSVHDQELGHAATVNGQVGESSSSATPVAGPDIFLGTIPVTESGNNSLGGICFSCRFQLYASCSASSTSSCRATHNTE